MTTPNTARTWDDVPERELDAMLAKKLCGWESTSNWSPSTDYRDAHYALAKLPEEKRADFMWNLWALVYPQNTDDRPEWKWEAWLVLNATPHQISVALAQTMGVQP